jgi:hypothetical protein
MSQQSIHDLDLAPNKPGKQYWVNGGRECMKKLYPFLSWIRDPRLPPNRQVIQNNRRPGVCSSIYRIPLLLLYPIINTKI